MGHIFISYSHKDKEYVYKLREFLQNEGFNIWLDDYIHYGLDWPKVIERQLDTSEGVIVVMSRSSHESEMVQNEVTRALDKKKAIFTLLLDGDNWLIVQAIQYVDVRDGSLPDKKFYKRLESVTTRKQSELPSVYPASTPRTKPKTIYIMIGGSIVLLGFLAVLGYSLKHINDASRATMPALDASPIVGGTVNSENITASSHKLNPLPFSIETTTPTLGDKSTATQFLVSPTSACVDDVAFVTATHLSNNFLLSFDTPFEISYEEMDKDRNVNFGNDLMLYVNTIEYSQFTAGLYDKNRPNRLFVFSSFQQGEKVQISFKYAGVQHCSPIVTVPYIEPPKQREPQPPPTPGKG